MIFKVITTGNNGLEVIGSGDGPARPEIVALAVELLNACGNALALASVWRERTRQITKGYDAAKDDRNEEGTLVNAATAFLCSAYGNYEAAKIAWPFDGDFKPSEHAPIPNGKGGRRADLVKAAACIVAEIERLDRERQC